jgi:hypothetical protein
LQWKYCEYFDLSPLTKDQFNESQDNSRIIGEFARKWIAWPQPHNSMR